ncbi:MAG: right-handed parallel beta-helix repeat-containing protein [Deltaproteobacteria bacterium]|nr:right-handed parallel beta-helix repeat-containing protein [Deltaproteobacteria bacterium]
MSTASPTVTIADCRLRDAAAVGHRATVRARGGALIAILAFAATVNAEATTYYVATTGSDSNPGTQASPWRTIGKSAAFMGPGDTAIIAGGTYAEKVTVTKSGTAAAPIKFQAASGQKAIIDGAMVSTGIYGSLWAFSSVSYVELDGLTIKNSQGFCVSLSGNSTHIGVGNLDVSNCAAAGAIWVEGSMVPSYSTFHDNKVHDNPHGGIVLWNSPGGYYLIERNRVWNNAGGGNFDGIQVGGEAAGLHHVVVRNNVAYDNGTATVGADQIDMGGHSAAHHYLLEGNDVWGVGGSIKIHGQPAQYTIARFNRATGFGFNEYDRPNAPAIYNNSIYDAAHAVLFYSDYVDSGHGSSFGGMELRNNLFVDSRDYTLVVAAVSGGKIDVRRSSLKLDGNMYRFGSKGISWSPRSYNCGLPAPNGDMEFAAFQAANAPEVQDPRGKKTTAAATAIFANPSARNYELIAGSPAIDAGVELTTTKASGTQTTTVPVVRASFFQDGYGGLIEPDQVKIGANAPVAIISVDDVNNKIVVATPISFASGASVNLPFSGIAPDVGAFEFAAGLPAPSLLSVDPVP